MTEDNNGGCGPMSLKRLESSDNSSPRVRRLKTLSNLEDAQFFIETFFWIVDKNSIKVPFVFNKIQKRYYAERSHNDLILKARKNGITSLISALWLHSCLTVPNTRAVIVSHEDESTKRLFDRVHFFVNNLTMGEHRLTVDLERDSAKQLSFPLTNSTYWVGTAGAKSFGRGDDITHLLLSEIAHYKNQDFLDGVLEACVNNAWRVLETTANGVGEAFYKMWHDKDSLWKKIFYAWFDNPEYSLSSETANDEPLSNVEIEQKQIYNLANQQILWYRQKKSALVDKSKMVEEYPSNSAEAFVTSGDSAFSLNKLALFLQRASSALWTGDIHDNAHQVSFIENQAGKLKIWKKPRQGRAYLITADPSQGIEQGGDWAVAQVIDRATWEQIAIWRGKVDPGHFGKILVDIAYFFNYALIMPELNNHGWATSERIRAENYPHVVRAVNILPESSPELIGFPVNEKTKNLYISSLRQAIDEESLYLNDKITIEELQTFVKDKTGHFRAQTGCHDDCVTSLGEAVFALRYLTVNETYKNNPVEKPKSFVHPRFANTQMKKIAMSVRR